MCNYDGCVKKGYGICHDCLETEEGKRRNKDEYHGSIILLLTNVIL